MSGMLDLLAHAYIGVVLESPQGQQETHIFIHNGDPQVRGKLQALITRDGYAAVYRIFQEQPSRRWRALALDTTDDLPPSDAQYPSAAWSRRAVPGYGVLSIGPGELVATTQRRSLIEPGNCETSYRIDSSGNIQAVR